MKRTFVCDESMLITIPIGSLQDAREGQLMPEKFQCVYRDFYKVFVVNGKPKPLGAAQAIGGVFIVTLGLIYSTTYSHNIYYPYGFLYGISLPSVVYVVTGMLSFAAGQTPNMHVTKLSFSLNIVSFFWSIAMTCIYGIITAGPPLNPLEKGINGLIITLLIVEKLMAVFLIYWLSKAVCRQDFNTLPIVLLKQGD